MGRKSPTPLCDRNLVLDGSLVSLCNYGKKHLMPCGFIHMASKVFGLVGWAGRIRTCGMRESKTRALPLGYGPL